MKGTLIMADERLLFTLEGRQEVARRMKELRGSEWQPGERGFLELTECIPVRDSGALDMLLEAVAKPLVPAVAPENRENAPQ